MQEGQMVNHWSPDQLRVTWPPSVLMYFFSSWTVFFTIYPMQFLSWLDSKALWQSIFSPRWFAPGKMVPNWSPDQHKCQTTWSHSVFPKVFLAIFQMYLSIPTKCISIWLTCPADHSPDRLISPRGATSDCSELTNISRSCLFVIPAPDRIPFLLWNLQHILVAFIPVLIEILLLH